jgi:hypothetical protein
MVLRAIPIGGDCRKSYRSVALAFTMISAPASLACLQAMGRPSQGPLVVVQFV